MEGRGRAARERQLNEEGDERELRTAVESGGRERSWIVKADTELEGRGRWGRKEEHSES